MILLALIGCSREKTAPLATPAPNNAPIAKAGFDETDFPFSSIRLLGGMADYDDNIQSLKWRKISGADDVLLEQEQTLTPRISNLKNGDYLFELSVTDTKLLVDRDTVRIAVSIKPIINGELIFTNLTWRFPWDAANIIIPHFRLNFPADKKFKVFIQRAASSNWIEVSPGNIGMYPYEYYVSEYTDSTGNYQYGDLHVVHYEAAAEDKPTVKIVF